MKIENQRLMEVCEYLKYQKKEQSLASISNAVFGHKNYFTALKRQDTNPSQMVINYLVDKYNVNSDYIWRGEGGMFRPQAATMSPAEVEEPIPDQQVAVIDAIKQGAQVVTDAKTIGATIVSPDVYEGIVEEIKAEMIVPIVPHEVALKAETNIKKFIEDNASELEHFDPRSVTAEVDTAERICTNSMYPTFLPGDVIFIQFLQEKSKITDGGIYYFDTSTRPTMIRLVKLLDDGRLLLKAFNPRYGDIYMRKDEITNIGKISGMYRQTFSDMYAEIEEVRRKKDEQVDSLIEQNSKALQIIKDLIKGN